jgi:hypothetical protein
MLNEFTSLFPCRLDSAVKRTGTTIWKQVSRFHYLSDQEIIDSIQSVSRLCRAVSFDTKTRFLVLSIPANSQFRNAVSLAQIRRELQGVCIETAAYQFEDSWYLYIYFSRTVNYRETADILKGWFDASCYQTGENVLQVLPTDVPLPLPLQPGFSWLDDDGNILTKREDLPLKTALELFHSDISKFETDPEVLERIKPLVRTAQPLSRQPDNSSSKPGSVHLSGPHSNPLELLQPEFISIQFEPESLTPAVMSESFKSDSAPINSVTDFVDSVTYSLEPIPETLKLSPVPDLSKSESAPPDPTTSSIRPEPETTSFEPSLHPIEPKPAPLSSVPVQMQPTTDHCQTRHIAELQFATEMQHSEGLEFQSLQSSCEPDLWRLLSESLDLDLDRQAPVNPAPAKPVNQYNQQRTDTPENIQSIALVELTTENVQFQEPEALEPGPEAHTDAPEALEAPPKIPQQDPDLLKPVPGFLEIEPESFDFEPVLTTSEPDLLGVDVPPHKADLELLQLQQSPLSPEPELIQSEHATRGPEPKIHSPIVEVIHPELAPRERQPRLRKSRTKTRKQEPVPTPDLPEPDSCPGSVPHSAPPLAVKRAKSSAPEKRSKKLSKTYSRNHSRPQSDNEPVAKSAPSRACSEPTRTQVRTQPGTAKSTRLPPDSAATSSGSSGYGLTSSGSRSFGTDPDNPQSAPSPPRFGTRRTRDGIQLILFPDLFTCERAPPDTG